MNLIFYIFTWHVIRHHPLSVTKWLFNAFVSLQSRWKMYVRFIWFNNNKRKNITIIAVNNFLTILNVITTINWKLCQLQNTSKINYVYNISKFLLSIKTCKICKEQKIAHSLFLNRAIKTIYCIIKLFCLQYVAKKYILK